MKGGTIKTRRKERKIYVEEKDFHDKKGKAIPKTGRGGPQGCETSRPPHFL
jgi:hypothetical protein